MTFAELREAGLAAGLLRPAFATTCAVEPCDIDAEMELRHAVPESDAVTWVPVCRGHEEARYRGEPLEYVVQIHGFLPRGDDLRALAKGP